MRLRADPSELHSARQYVDEAALAFGLDAQRRYEFVYAANEVVTNAIRHGTPDEDGTIGLRIAADGDTLTCTVHDRGQFEFPAGDPDVLATDGRGFAFITKLTDRVELCIDADSTVVRLFKRRAAS